MSTLVGAGASLRSRLHALRSIVASNPGGPVGTIPTNIKATQPNGSVVNENMLITNMAYVKGFSQATCNLFASQGIAGYHADINFLNFAGGDSLWTADPTAVFTAGDGRTAAAWAAQTAYRANNVTARVHAAGQKIFLGCNAATSNATWADKTLWPEWHDDDEWARLLNDNWRLDRSGLTSGTFTLTFNGQTTAAIAYNATAAQIQTALESLANIASGDIRCFTVGNSTYIVFVGNYYATYISNTMFSGSLGSLVGTTKTLLHEDGRNLYHFAAASYWMGCDGIYFDLEQYAGATANVTPSWQWNYTGHPFDEATTRALAVQRGAEMMRMFVKVWVSRKINITFYNWESKESWLYDVVRGVTNNQSHAGADADVRINVFDGWTSVAGYGDITFVDNTIQKITQGPNGSNDFNGATQYNSCKMTAWLSRSFSRWDLACDKFNISPFVGISPFSVGECPFAYARSPQNVQSQMAASRKYAMRNMAYYDYSASYITHVYADCASNYGGTGWTYTRTQSGVGSYIDVMTAADAGGLSSTIAPIIGTITATRAPGSPNVTLAFDVAHADGMRNVKWRVWSADGLSVDMTYSNTEDPLGEGWYAFPFTWVYGAGEFTGSNWAATTAGKARVSQSITVPAGRYVEVLGTSLHDQVKPGLVLV